LVAEKEEGGSGLKGVIRLQETHDELLSGIKDFPSGSWTKGALKEDKGRIAKRVKQRSNKFGGSDGPSDLETGEKK